ncbi:cupin domain-containing protein [Mesorhizobium sp. CC13]|uniref:cupin domain-containing protein n=1 Tax=Mesorhizobium sp. CC13 TaxID=3029194 RepID=UPI0032649EAF
MGRKARFLAWGIPGGAYGADVSVVFFITDRVGGGPKLHTHPYPEIFIVRVGRALFTVDDVTIEAEAGQILVAKRRICTWPEPSTRPGWNEPPVRQAIALDAGRSMSMWGMSSSRYSSDTVAKPKDE